MFCLKLSIFGGKKKEKKNLDPPPENFTIGLCTELPLVILHC